MHLCADLRLTGWVPFLSPNYQCTNTDTMSVLKLQWQQYVEMYLGKTSFPGNDSFGDSILVAKRSFLTRTPTYIPQMISLVSTSSTSSSSSTNPINDCNQFNRSTQSSGLLCNVTHTATRQPESTNHNVTTKQLIYW